ncbi:MAG: glycosyltransferase family 39 protein [Rhodospirillales bacterium]|nr:glycosyltransferase family 39 protein [Rhodospirillales bacterium]
MSGDRDPEVESAPTPLWEVLGLALPLTGLVLLLQYLANAYSGTFADDDASHYINGLLIHDYLLHGLGRSPISYLIWFHSHYPLVGIGHWAPGYYLVEALWMLLVSTSLHGTLVLSALVTTTLALVVYILLRRRVGWLIAMLGAVGLVVSPIIQNGSMELMLDIPVALTSLLAALAYARYLRAGTAGSALLFGVVASAAIMIKGNGAALALVPPIAVLVTGRWNLLRQRNFWLPVPVVLVLAGAWYAITYSQIAAGFRYAWGLHYMLVALRANSAILYHGVGPVVLVFAAMGVFDTLRYRRGDPTWAVLVALLFGVWLFQMIAPAAIQDRYLAPLLAPVFCFAGIGLYRVARRVARRGLLPAVVRPALVAVTALSLVPAALSANRLPDNGYFAAARLVRKLVPAQNPVVLVVTPPPGEGAMISALASIDPARPSLFVVRGSRLLGGGGYNNSQYLPRFSHVQQVIHAIDHYGIPLLVFRDDRRVGAWEHIRQVREAAFREGSRWQIIARTGPAAHPVIIMRLRENDQRVADPRALVRLSGPKALLSRKQGRR